MKEIKLQPIEEWLASLPEPVYIMTMKDENKWLAKLFLKSDLPTAQAQMKEFMRRAA